MVLLALQRSSLTGNPEVREATPTRGQLAPLDAEPRRRLGGLRRRHQQPDPHQGPVRRPQRDARPELRRHHRADPRDPRDARATAPTTRRSPAPWTISGARRSRKGAGTAAGASTTSTGPGRSCRGCRRSTSRWTTRRSARRPTGWNRSSRPTAAGASRAGATTTRRGWAGARPPPRRRPGASSAWSPPAGPTATPPAAASSSCSRPRSPTAPGTSRPSPGPGSPASST